MTLSPIPAWTVEQTQTQIQTHMQMLPVTQGQTLGMSLTLMTVLTLTGQVMVLLRIWAKAARGVWGLAHVFNNKLFFTRDIMDDDAVPKHFNVPEPKPKPKPKPALKPKAAPKPRGSTDRNSGWCITGRRVSRQNQLNIRSFHARWKAHYSQSAEIQSFGVHLSMWLTVGKERRAAPHRA